MSTLLVDELYPGVVVSQPIKITKGLTVAHVRPWVYKHGTLASGTFTLKVYEGVTLLATSEIPFSEINDQSLGTYAHGFMRFDFENLVLNVPEGATEQEYILEFSMPGYTKDTNNFLAMTRRWELKVYDTYGVGVINNESLNDSTEPFGLEIFEYKVV